MKIIFFGMGKKLQKTNQYIGKAINRDCEVVAISDSKVCTSEGNIVFGGEIIPIVSPEDIRNMEYDYVIIATSDLYVDEIYQKLLGVGVKEEKIWTYDMYENDHLEKVKELLLKKYYCNEDVEMCELINYLDNNPLRVFNGMFRDNYSVDDVEVFYDSNFRMYFTMYNGNKMYLKKVLIQNMRQRNMYVH